MAIQNGQTVSDVKKATSNFAADVKSEAKKIGSDLKSDFNSSNFKSDLKSDAKDLKSDAKSAVSKISDSADQAVGQGSSIANTLISSVASMIPVKNADEALEMLQSTADDVQSGLVSARDSAASFIKKYPFYSLLGAGLIGAAAVMLLSPRKSTSTRLH